MNKVGREGGSKIQTNKQMKQQTPPTSCEFISFQQSLPGSSWSRVEGREFWRWACKGHYDQQSSPEGIRNSEA